VLAALDAIAGRLNAKPAQVALAWLMAKIAAPIASATSLAQLRDLAGAAKLSLTPDDVRALETASA
jgi:aryl-alcohol dehydrogenase-like predicted oxidoreductase